MSDGGDPELPTTALWRGWMVSRREALGLTQTDLGRKVGLSQPIISEIESGKQARSVAVLAISRVLGIPPPYLEIEDDVERRLLEAARILRHTNVEVFATQLQLIETLARSLTRQG